MSDADELDDELLAVAGRPRQTPGKRRRQAADDSDEDGMLSEELSSDDDEPRKRPAKLRASAGRGRGAAAAEASDDSGYDDGYDSDLMGDDEDRARLADMNELDREMILAQRGEERDAAIERRRNAKMAAQAQQAAAAAEGAEQMRSSTRVKRPDRAKKGALAELQAARRKKTQRSGKKGRRAADSDSDYSLSEGGDEGGSPAPAAPPPPPAAAAAAGDSDGGPLSGEDSEDERARADQELSDDDDLRDADGQGRVIEDASYEDVLSIQVRRHRLESWADKPFFDRVLRGCMVRVVIPPAAGSSQREPGYVMAQIREVVTREPGTYRDMGGRPMKSPYQFGPGGAKTHRWIKIARGTSERTIAMSIVSNSAAEEHEFRRWIEQCEKDQVALPTVADIDMIQDQLKSAETYTYTSEDVTRMIEERRAKGAKGFNVAAERMRLSNLREYEAGRGDAEAVARIEAQLAQLEAKAAERREETTKVAAGMAGVNKRNTGQNFVNAFTNVAAAVQGSRAAMAGADPFSRRQTQSRNYWTTRRNDAVQNGEQEVAERAAEELAALDTGGADAAEDALDDDDDDGPAATVHQNSDTGAVELDIDISVLDRPRPPAIVTRLLGSNWLATLSKLAVPSDIATRKVLTLADYKRRQGIA